MLSKLFAFNQLAYFGSEFLQSAVFIFNGHCQPRVGAQAPAHRPAPVVAASPQFRADRQPDHVGGGSGHQQTVSQVPTAPLRRRQPEASYQTVVDALTQMPIASGRRLAARNNLVAPLVVTSVPTIAPPVIPPPAVVSAPNDGPPPPVRRQATLRQSFASVLQQPGAPTATQSPPLVNGAAGGGLPVVHRNYGQCAICMDEMTNNCEQLQSMPCGHLFHGACIHHWMNFKNIPWELACPFKCFRSHESVNPAVSVMILIVLVAVANKKIKTNTYIYTYIYTTNNN